jgi:hypothetical protein
MVMSRVTKRSLMVCGLMEIARGKALLEAECTGISPLQCHAEWRMSELKRSEAVG